MNVSIEQQNFNQVNAIGSGVQEPIMQEEYEIITAPGVDFGYSEIKKIGTTWFPWQPFELLPKRKIWGSGLFEGLDVNEEDIEKAKKSLFPDRF